MRRSCRCRSVRDRAKPLLHRVHIVEPPPRHRGPPPGPAPGPPAHLDGVPAQLVDGCESEFIARVVTDEHRRAAGERRLRHELAQRPALVLAGGLQLHDALALLEAILSVEVGKQRFHGLMHESRQPGDAAVVQGERESFVFEEETGFVNDGLGQTLAHGCEVLRGLVACRPSRGAAPLRTVLAGSGQLHGWKQRVDLGDGTAAHECDRPAGAVIQLLQLVSQALGDANGGRRFGEVDERTIDIEEVGPVAPWLRRGETVARVHLAGALCRSPPRGATNSGTRPRRRLLAASSSMRPAQRNTLKSWSRPRISRMRMRCSVAGMVRATSSAAAHSSVSYGLTINASGSSRAAPVKWLKMRTPRWSSRADTNSFATRFMPSCRLVTAHTSAPRYSSMRMRVGAAIWMNVNFPIHSGFSSNSRSTARIRSSMPLV